MLRSWGPLVLLRKRWLLLLPAVAVFGVYILTIIFTQGTTEGSRWESTSRAWIGLGFVGFTFLAFLLVTAWDKMVAKGEEKYPQLARRFSSKEFVTVYRPYEHRALQNGAMELKDLLNYHSQYHWGEYAAVTVGMVLVSVILMFDKDTVLPKVGIMVQPIVVALMTISSIALVWADLVHTNTQTPIIPINTRFKLIDMSVVLGTVGTMLMVFSVLLLIALINLEATIVSCSAFVAILVYSYRTRRVHKREFFDYFKVYSEEGWEEIDGNLIMQNQEEQRQYVGDDDDQLPERERKVKPYRPGTNQRLDTYREYLARSEATGDLTAVLADLRLCLGISPREHRWMEQELRRGKEHFEALVSATLGKGVPVEEAGKMLRRVAAEMHLSEKFVEGMLKNQGFSKPG